MKNFYLIQNPDGWPLPAIADLSELPDGAWWIHRLNVPCQRRGRGFGSQLLKLITDDADTEAVELVLTCASSGPLDDDALREWYSRHGFVEQGMPYRMVRFPDLGRFVSTHRDDNEADSRWPV